MAGARGAVTWLRGRRRGLRCAARTGPKMAAPILCAALLLAAWALRPADAVSEPATVAFDVQPGGAVHSFSQNAGPGVSEGPRRAGSGALPPGDFEPQPVSPVTCAAVPGGRVPTVRRPPATGGHGEGAQRRGGSRSRRCSDGGGADERGSFLPERRVPNPHWRWVRVPPSLVAGVAGKSRPLAAPCQPRRQPLSLPCPVHSALGPFRRWGNRPRKACTCQDPQ